MAATQTVKKLFTEAAIIAYDHDPGTTNPLIVSPDGGTTKRYVDMRDYGGFAVIAMASLLAGSGITKVEIVAAVDTDGTDLQVITDSGTVAAAAVGDVVVQECTAEQVKEVAVSSGKNLRYVGARLTCQNAGDEAVVTYIRHKARFPQDALTANAIA